jgi:hypothetical protein
MLAYNVKNALLGRGTLPCSWDLEIFCGINNWGFIKLIDTFKLKLFES